MLIWSALYCFANLFFLFFLLARLEKRRQRKRDTFKKKCISPPKAQIDVQPTCVRTVSAFPSHRKVSRRWRGDAEGKFFMFGYFYIIPPPVYTFDVSSRLSLVSLCWCAHFLFSLVSRHDPRVTLPSSFLFSQFVPLSPFSLSPSDRVRDLIYWINNMTK